MSIHKIQFYALKEAYSIETTFLSRCLLDSRFLEKCIELNHLLPHRDQCSALRNKKKLTYYHHSRQTDISWLSEGILMQTILISSGSSCQQLCSDYMHCF